MNSKILVLGDLHFPYEHKDAFDFIRHCKQVLKPDRVIQIGDEVDGHSWSFHKSNPDLLSPGAELTDAIARIKDLEKIFWQMDLLESNHGSLVYRKQVDSGLPKGFFKGYNEIYDVNKNWAWHFDLTVKMSNGSYCYFHHGKSACVLKTSMSMGMSSVAGHFHEKMGVQYWANSLGLYFAAQTGCLVDDKSLAMSYNNTNLKRPLLGSLLIENGVARTIPMILNKSGRWIRRLI